MNVNEVELNGIKYVRKDSIVNKKIELSDRVIVRTRNAGVHIGTVQDHNPLTLVLVNSNRLWKWKGAFTLSEVAMKGIDRSGSRIATLLPIITLTSSDVCEIIPIKEGLDFTECDNA
jgi:hypothetical protein